MNSSSKWNGCYGSNCRYPMLFCLLIKGLQKSMHIEVDTFINTKLFQQLRYAKESHSPK